MDLQSAQDSGPYVPFGCCLGALDRFEASSALVQKRGVYGRAI